MGTVTLQSRVGSQEITIRQKDASPIYLKWEYPDLKAKVPVWWWEEVQNEYFKPDRGSMRWKEAFKPI